MVNEPLVLIPGMMCDARLLGPQIAAFSSARTVHIPEITAKDTVEALAEDVLRRAPERFALAGLSMGGIVAMEMIAQAPERITRLCLMDTNPKSEHPSVREGREPQIEKARQGSLRAVMRDEMKPNYLSNGPNRQATLDLCMDMAMDLGPEIFVRQSRALQSRPDQQDALTRVDVKTLVLCGRDDSLCPIARHELMKDLIPNARLEIVEEAGHLPTLENAVSTNAALKKWLEI